MKFIWVMKKNGRTSKKLKELKDMNDSLLTQRKSLQKAREGLQKEVTKLLKEKDTSEAHFKKKLKEAEQK